MDLHPIEQSKVIKRTKTKRLNIVASQNNTKIVQADKKNKVIEPVVFLPPKTEPIKEVKEDIKIELVKKDIKTIKTPVFDKPKNRLSIKLLAIITTVIVSVTAFSTLEFGYAAYIDKTEIGSVKSFDEGEKLIKEVNSDMATFFDGRSAITGKPEFFLKLVLRDGFTEPKVIKENIKATSKDFIKAWTLTAQGEPVFAMLDKSGVNEVINLYKDGFKNEKTVGEPAFDKQLVVEDLYVPRNLLMSEQAALDKIAGGTVAVVTIENDVEAKEIPFEVQQVSDDTLYKGKTVIAQNGVNGQKQVSEEIKKINGVEKERNVIEEKILTQPTVKIVKVGTKDLPKGLGDGSFIKPSVGTLSSRFGSRWGRQHKGIDIAGSYGTEIKAADEGKVIYSGWMEGFGNLIQIDHGNGYVTFYGHCSALTAKVGDVVGKGDVIAKMGNTGNSSGTHLHFEVRLNGKAIDPLKYLSF